MSNGNKSDVERFYDAVAAKLGITKPFSALNPIQQSVLIQGINMILNVITQE